MNFGNINYILWIIPILLVLLMAFVLYYYLKFQQLARLGDNPLISRLIRNNLAYHHYLIPFSSLVGVAFALLALARPQFGAVEVEARQKGLDLVMAIDVSKSMLVPDVAPNRLQRARLELSRFLREKAKGDRVAIVPFAGNAFTLCPLTLDYSAVAMFLESVSGDMIAQGGTDIAKALEKSAGLFDEKRSRAKVIALLTDGEDHSGQGVKVAKKLAEKGIVIYTVGIGTSKGEPIPIGHGENGEITYLRDSKGHIVVSELDEKALVDMASITGGQAFFAGPGQFGLGKVYDAISQLKREEITAKKTQAREDRFQYPLGLGILFLLPAIFIPNGHWKRKASGEKKNTIF